MVDETMTMKNDDRKMIGMKVSPEMYSSIRAKVEREGYISISSYIRSLIIADLN